MNINIKELGKISNIGISDEEERIFLEQIESVVKFLDEYKHSQGKEKADPIVEFDNIREDEPKNSLTVEEALMNTYEKKYSYFQVTEFVNQ